MVAYSVWNLRHGLRRGDAHTLDPKTRSRPITPTLNGLYILNIVPTLGHFGV